jgi:nitrite reductase (NADH) small subunit
MGTLHTVGRAGELRDGDCSTVTFNHKTIAIFRVAGNYYAIDNTCPHMGAELSGGFVEDGIVICPWHYWRFRLADGTWADNPRIKIGSYPVHIIGDEIQIELPDQA